MTNLRNEFAIITLVIPITEGDQWPRPDKTDWTQLTDHNARIQVRSCEYVGPDDLLRDEIEELSEPYQPDDIFVASDLSSAKADSWFWQIGSRWVAVAGEAESDWFLDMEMPGECPQPRTYPVTELPPSGTLVYRTPDGEPVEIDVEFFFTEQSITA